MHRSTEFTAAKFYPNSDERVPEHNDCTVINFEEFFPLAYIVSLIGIECIRFQNSVLHDLQMLQFVGIWDNQIKVADYCVF